MHQLCDALTLHAHPLTAGTSLRLTRQRAASTQPAPAPAMSVMPSYGVSCRGDPFLADDLHWRMLAGRDTLPPKPPSELFGTAQDEASADKPAAHSSAEEEGAAASGERGAGQHGAEEHGAEEHGAEVDSPMKQREGEHSAGAQKPGEQGGMVEGGAETGLPTFKTQRHAPSGKLLHGILPQPATPAPAMRQPCVS